ncbi:hypothetical protein LNV07_13600 [Paucibacter oligotrophus]|uniref:Uncharacterized protein n=1 Tax=Roseateles oligotrophus TaxID=1769250 RepID=A0ABT2YGJ9_9BURK|nr:hypothetical protein [Roseateles oligotrophus]
MSLAIVPNLRGRLNEKFARGAWNQSLFVETVSGIQPVKASALEPQMSRRREAQLAAYVATSFKTQALAQYGHAGQDRMCEQVEQERDLAAAQAALKDSKQARAGFRAEAERTRSWGL